MKNVVLTSAVIVALVLAAGLPALAQDEEPYQCTNADLKGLYTFTSQAFRQYDVQGNPTPLPAPAVGVGYFEADGMGRFPGAFNSESQGWQEPAAQSGGSALDKRYTVNPNCTGTATFAHPATGNTLIDFRFVITNGGRMAHFITLENQHVLLLTARRVGSFDEDLEAKVDALTANVKALSANLSLIMKTMGLIAPSAAGN